MNDRIIVLEGIDGAGKSTQSRVVAQHLSSLGWRVAEPTRSRNSRLRSVHKALIKEADGFLGPLASVLLGFSDYADLFESRRDRSGDDCVLLDRYCYSTVTDGIALGLEPSRLVPLIGLLPRPQRCFYIDLPATVSLARKRTCTLAEAGGPVFSAGYPTREAAFLAYQERLRQAYRLLIDRGLMPHCVIVDGTMPAERVSAEILGALDALSELGIRGITKSVGHA